MTRGAGLTRVRWWRPIAALGLVAFLFGNASCSSGLNPTGGAAYSSTDLKVGSGAIAFVGSVITVKYIGWLYDPAAFENKGIEFDSTDVRGPLQFTLGNGDVVQGWDLGLPGMLVGGIRRIVVPPQFGYGGVRHGVIPPNATMVFEIELLSIQ